MRRSFVLGFLAVLAVTRAQDAPDLKALNGVLAAVLKASHDPIGELTPDVLAKGEKAAQQLLAIDRPETLSNAQWQAMRASGFKVLGWAAIMRGEAVASGQAFVESLKLDPDDVAISYELARAMFIQQKDHHAEALYHLARAAVLEGPGALQPAERATANTYLVNSYLAYFGTDDGLETLKAMAKTQALPPEGFPASFPVRKMIIPQPRKQVPR
jgi:thioredoxin-like negative regulator of GroEL